MPINVRRSIGALNTSLRGETLAPSPVCACSHRSDSGTNKRIIKVSSAGEAPTRNIHRHDSTVTGTIHATAPTGFDIRRTGFSKPKITALLASLREEKPDPIKPPPPLKLPIHPAWQAAASAAGLSLPDWSLATLNAAAA